ncbi:MAG TPA: phosphocholine cytidylyltransferase family protein [Candidatus Ozemobacteraceae bacterium]|nr:phosphocholine cytidylyltransferase family protein [Candidatus Ozemobacteraceae bacterium]
MIAVILAAGLGNRLRPLTETMPKALIPIEGVSLIERSITNLHRAGVRKAIVVTGYLADSVRQALRNPPEGMEIEFIYNDEYETTGSMVSFLKARQRIQEDVLLLESDLIYSNRALPLLLNTSHPDAILISNPLNAGDDVLVRADSQGNLMALGKNLDAEHRQHAQGCLVGISRFSPQTLEKLFRLASERLRANFRQDHYEECVLMVARNKTPIATIHCADMPWTEIDNEADYERARSIVFPNIKRTDGFL